MNRFNALNKLLALGVLAAFALLLMELRFDHRNVLGEHWQAWALLNYSGLMIITGVCWPGLVGLRMLAGARRCRTDGSAISIYPCADRRETS